MNEARDMSDNPSQIIRIMWRNEYSSTLETIIHKFFINKPNKINIKHHKVRMI